MYAVSEYFADLNKAGVDHAVKLAYTALGGAEQLININLAAVKSAVETNAKSAKALADVKDVNDLVALRAKLTETGMEQALAYSREAYDVTSATQAEMAKVVESSVASFNKSIASMVDKAVKSAPAGSDVAVTALKSTMAATTAAMDQFSKATRQVVDFADASVRAAASKAAAVAAPAVKGGRRAA